jgi:iron transport multicopper oxidase
MVYGGGYATIRFKADNPGIALFHCHIEWHVEAGLTISFIEAPEQLQALKLRLPDSHNDACKKLGIPLKGNAAGNYGTNAQWLNLTGANTDPVLSDWG